MCVYLDDDEACDLPDLSEVGEVGKVGKGGKVLKVSWSYGLPEVERT